MKVHKEYLGPDYMVNMSEACQVLVAVVYLAVVSSKK